MSDGPEGKGGEKKKTSKEKKKKGRERASARPISIFATERKERGGKKRDRLKFADRKKKKEKN